MLSGLWQPLESLIAQSQRPRDTRREHRFLPQQVPPPPPAPQLEPCLPISWPGPHKVCHTAHPQACQSHFSPPPSLSSAPSSPSPNI